MEKILVLVKDLESICQDRLEAKTADGRVLADVFKELDELINKELAKKK